MNAFNYQLIVTNILKGNFKGTGITSTRFLEIQDWCDATYGKNEYQLYFSSIVLKTRQCSEEWVLYVKNEEDLTLFTLKWNCC